MHINPSHTPAQRDKEAFEDCLVFEIDLQPRVAAGMKTPREAPGDARSPDQAPATVSLGAHAQSKQAMRC